MSAPVVLFKVQRNIMDAGAFGTMWYYPIIQDDIGDWVRQHHVEPIPFALTLERTYESHESDKRLKIIDGIWYCTRRRYNKGKYMTWEIHVPEHKYCLFHKGNKELHSDGCTLVAENFHDFDPAVGLQGAGIGNSKGGFGEFMSLTKDVDHFFTEFVTVGGA